MKINCLHPKYFTRLDLPYALEDRPLGWHKRGLTWTASGYGQAIPSRFVAIITLPDRRQVTRRVYTTIYSNVGSSWVILDGTARIVG